MRTLSKEKRVEMAQAECIEMFRQYGGEAVRKAVDAALGVGLSMGHAILAGSMADFASTDGTYKEWFLSLPAMGFNTKNPDCFSAIEEIREAGLFPWTETTI